MLPRKRHCEGVHYTDNKSFPNKNRIVSAGASNSNVNSDQRFSTSREAMQKLFAASVLISGMQGLGVEIAKNVILSGVKSVTLHDEGDVELWDLSAAFVFSATEIGRNRADASVSKLQELNHAVVVQSLKTRLTKEDLSNFEAVVFTDTNIEKAIEFDDYCHNHKPPIAFIKAEVRGLFGSVFCDFGPEFSVSDGGEPHTGIISSISNCNPARVYCDDIHGFQEGDFVIFSEVKGMEDLNDGKPRKTKNVMGCMFEVEEDTTGYGIYEEGGIVTQVQQPKVLNFKPLRDALSDPGDFLLSDFSKFDRPILHHVAFQALDRFISLLGRFPVAGVETDAVIFMNAVKMVTCNLKVSPSYIDEKILRDFAFGARAILNPMAAMFGGIVGQEVVKACTQKFNPLFQFFYFDSVESLPSKPPRDVRPVNSRYDAQISIFGRNFQTQLEDFQVFVMGSGALGCELLKTLALMGVSCGNQGRLTITDHGIIKDSNLSKQFLFREWNTGQAKSTIAASAATSINNSFRVKALQNRVEDEVLFNETFWAKQNVVINALNNVNTRLYVDQRCFYFQKPLLDSITHETQCDMRIVIPHLTEKYGAFRDPPEKQAPMCYAPSFPHNIDHCFTWARSEFDDLLMKIPIEVNSYLSNPTNYYSLARSNTSDAQAKDNLERVLDCLDKEKCADFTGCITWARLKFEDYFANEVNQIVYKFPRDTVTSTGAPFWSAPKRFPCPLKFATSDPDHLDFVISASVLRAETLGIQIPKWAKNTKIVANLIDRVKVPRFVPSFDPKVTRTLIRLERCREKLSPAYRMKPIQFEKDDDTNYHMEFIAGLANMRARNYSIPEVDKPQAKLIAGPVVPAIATTSAVATGLVCLELYKVIDRRHKVEHYRNSFVNLAVPFFSMSGPVPPKILKHQDMSWMMGWEREYP